MNSYTFAEKINNISYSATLLQRGAQNKATVIDTFIII